MEQPELSLGPTTNLFNVGTDASVRKKRKQAWDEPSIPFTSVELQLNDPLPLDWEQCLDLQSGRMYYLNRKTLKKSLIKPKEQKLDLELNISTPQTAEWKTNSTPSETKKIHMNSGGNNMVAIACFNCHLLVMLCKSSPTCPNCKHLNSLAKTETDPPRKLQSVKPFETLSLLH